MVETSCRDDEQRHFPETIIADGPSKFNTSELGNTGRGTVCTDSQLNNCVDDKLMGCHTIKMPMGQKMEDSGTRSSRRQVLKTLGVIAAGLSVGDVIGKGRGKYHPNNTINDISKERKQYFNKTIEYNMKDVPAYITDPGFSLPSLLANLPYILNFSDGPTPVIIMDTHDYDRLRARVTTETENEKIQYLGMAYEELRRRKMLHLLDYAKLYPPTVQQRILHQNRAILEETSDWAHQRAAVRGIKGLEKYGWGRYQQPFRSNLGEDPDTFASDRNAVVQQRERIEQGRGNPVEWNRAVVNEYMTALKIRHRADQILNFNVQGVIGQGDSELLSQLIDATSQGETADVSHIKELKPNRHMFRFNPKAAEQTREILDHVGEIAADVVGVQHEDWSFLGPTLALPKFKNFDHIQSQIRGSDVESLIEETKEALALIEKRANGQSLDQARYEANWMVEQYDLSQNRCQELTKEFSYALDLVDHSQDLRNLGEGDNISRPAFFLVASVLSDPTHRYETNDLYRHARDLLSQLGPSSVTETQLETYRQRGDYLRGETSDTAPDWFENPDRTR